MSKNLKKTLTVIMSLAMLFSMAAPALADEVIIDELPDSLAITGEGDVNFFDVPDVIRVIIPTDAALDFTLDPLGLSALREGGPGMTLDELREGPNAGAVDFNKYTPVVINESTEKVLVEFNVHIDGDAVPVASEALVNPATPTDDANLFIGMSVSADSVSDVLADEDTFAGTKQLALTDSAQTVSFVLDEAEYLVYLKGGEYVYEMNDEKDGFGTQLLFEGYCNPYGDWKDFMNIPATLAKGAVYTYAGLKPFVDAITVAGTIEIGGQAFDKVAATPGANEFVDADGLIVALNTHFDGTAVFAWNVNALVATTVATGVAADFAALAPIAGAGTYSDVFESDEDPPDTYTYEDVQAAVTAMNNGDTFAVGIHVFTKADAPDTTDFSDDLELLDLLNGIANGDWTWVWDAGDLVCVDTDSIGDPGDITIAGIGGLAATKVDGTAATDASRGTSTVDIIAIFEFKKVTGTPPALAFPVGVAYGLVSPTTGWVDVDRGPTLTAGFISNAATLGVLADADPADFEFSTTRAPITGPRNVWLATPVPFYAGAIGFKEAFRVDLDASFDPTGDEWPLSATNFGYNHTNRNVSVLFTGAGTFDLKIILNDDSEYIVRVTIT